MPATKKKDDEPDLLSGLSDDAPATTAVDDGESYDLLDGLSEDEGTPWIPTDDDDPSPSGVQGKVTFRGELASDYGPDPIPLVEIESADGMKWSIRGYSTVLRNQINKTDPQVGDFFAVRHFGSKTSKSGRDYENYKAAVKKAA